MVLAKRTSKNQLTLPKAVVEAVGIAVLTPVHPNAASHVRSRLEELGITEADVAAAVAWSRQE
jgi:type II secretory ATPase GspE/PulE/Tfp pilus assembly ATPase PilB-like protein